MAVLTWNQIKSNLFAISEVHNLINLHCIWLDRQAITSHLCLLITLHYIVLFLCYYVILCHIYVIFILYYTTFFILFHFTISWPQFKRFRRNLAHWCIYHNMPWYWYCFRGWVRLDGKGRFWCAACNSVNRTCSTSTLFYLIFIFI